MTVLAVPDKQASVERDSNKIIVTMPAIGIFANPLIGGPGGLDVLRGGYCYFTNLLKTHGLAPLDNIETRNTLSIGSAYNTGAKAVLSRDKQFCYVCANNKDTASPYPGVYKIHIATNTITHTYGYPISTFFQAIAIDSHGDIFVGGCGTGENKDDIELIKLNGDDLTKMWAVTRPGVSSIAVDANDNIYVTISEYSGDPLYTKNIYHYDGATGEALWAQGISTVVDYEGQAQIWHRAAFRVVIDSAGRVFVVAQQYHYGATANSLYEIDPDAANDGALIMAGDIGYSGSGSLIDVIVLPDDSLLTLCFDHSPDGKYIRKWTTNGGAFTEVTAGNFPIFDDSVTWALIKNAPMRTFFVIKTYGYRVYNHNGTFVMEGTLITGPSDFVFPAIKGAEHIRPSTTPETFPAEPPLSLDLAENKYPDMPCFLAPVADIPVYDPNSTYSVGDLFYTDCRDGTGQYRYIDQTRTGTWKVHTAISSTPHTQWSIWDNVTKISNSMPCEHSGWDLYAGYGGEGGGGLVVNGVQTGIGNSPTLYTATVFGVLQDGGSPSPHNGDYILLKGPGLFGFFYHFDPSTGFHLIFNICHMAMNTYTPDADASTRIRAFLEPELTTQYPVLGLIDGGAGVDQIVLSGDHAAPFVNGVTLKLKGSSVEPNDGTYITSGSIATGGATIIDIPTGSLTDAGATGGTIEVIPPVDMIYKSTVDVDLATQRIATSGEANEYTAVTTNVIGYNGVISLYPGPREKWDAITVWPAGSIVACEGYFYQANNQNQNSKPPSGDWAVL